MNQAETNRFNELYQRHLRLLKFQGKSQKTIDAYSRAMRRIKEHFDCCPDQLTLKQREQYFWFFREKVGKQVASRQKAQ